MGLCLLLGLLTRVAAGVSMLLLVAFVVGVGSAWARGLSIECGCFGGGAGPAANAQAKYPWEIARDLGLLALSAWLVVRPRTPWAIDNRLLPPEPVPSRREHAEDERRERMTRKKSTATRRAESQAAAAGPPRSGGRRSGRSAAAGRWS